MKVKYCHTLHIHHSCQWSSNIQPEECLTGPPPVKKNVTLYRVIVHALLILNISHMTVNALLIFFMNEFINMHNCCKALWPLNMISVDDLHVGQIWVCRKKVGHLLFLYVNRKWFCWEPCMEDLGSYDFFWGLHPWLLLFSMSVWKANLSCLRTNLSWHKILF